MAFPGDGVDGLAAGGVPDGSWGSSSTLGVTPVLAGCSDVSLHAGGRSWLLGVAETAGGGGRILSPRAEWRALVDSWVSGEGYWRLELGCGVLCWKLADGLISGQKME